MTAVELKSAPGRRAARRLMRGLPLHAPGTSGGAARSGCAAGIPARAAGLASVCGGGARSARSAARSRVAYQLFPRKLAVTVFVELDEARVQFLVALHLVARYITVAVLVEPLEVHRTGTRGRVGTG